MKKIYSILFVLIISQDSFAVVAGSKKLEGYVTAFDDKKIVIESGNQAVEVPAELYKYKVKTGEKISVIVSDQAFEKLKTEKLKKK